MTPQKCLRASVGRAPVPTDHRVADCLAIAGAAVVPLLTLRPLQNVPFIDDWVYAWSVEELLRSGRLLFLESSTSINVTQVLWGALFCLPGGFSFTALRASTYTLAVATLCGLYLLLREVQVSRREAVLGVVTIAFFPIFFLLSVTFMTDVPFVAFLVWTTVAMVRALQRRSTLLLVAAVLLASFAIGVRLIGFAIPVAMLGTVFVGRDPWGRRQGRPLLLLFPLLVLLLLVMWHRSHIVDSADLTWVRNSPANRIQDLRWALRLLPRMLLDTFAFLAGAVGLALVPLSAGLVDRHHLRRNVMILGGVLVILGACGYYGVEGVRLPLTHGQTWSLVELGATQALVPHEGPAATPAALTWAAFAVATVSLVVSLAEVRWNRALKQPFFLWMVGALYLCTALLWLTYDRYVLTFLPFAVALVLGPRVRVHVLRTVPLVILFATVSFAGTLDHLHYNAALWNAVDVLRTAGVPERDIDGGYVVNGWLQYAHPDRAYRDETGTIRIPSVNSKEQKVRYQVSNQPRDGWTVVTTQPYRRWFAPSGQVYILRRN